MARAPGHDITGFYASFDSRGERTTAWLFRGFLFVMIAAFLGIGVYFRTIEPPPERAIDKIARVRSRFLVEEENEPVEKIRPKKPPPKEKKPEGKPAAEKKPPEEPIDLTKDPELDREQDDIVDKPPQQRKVRRVYGLRKVYSKGLGSGGDQADAVIGKRGNTLNKPIDTLTATDEEVKGQVVSTTTVGTPPRFKKRVKPAYTDEMRDNGVEGTVKVKVLVDIDGKVKKAILLNDLGYGTGEQALAACRKLEFHPAMRDDRPVAVWIVVPIRFVLLR